MASTFLRLTKEETGVVLIGSATEGKVAGFICYVCALNLQKVLEVMASCWTFSLAMDMSTHMSTSYLDIQICLFIGGKIENLHLLAIPMFSSHAAEQIFVHAEKVLDVLCPRWRDLILSISTDSKRKMTGRVSGVVTRFEHVAKPGFFWLQLDIVLQRFFKNLMNEEFYSLLTSLISYLQCQQNLIKDMKTKAKKVADTRWESMSEVAAWFLEYHVPVQEYLAVKKPPCAPPLKWWILVYFVSKVLQEATITFRSLEGLLTLVSHQREGILKLTSTIASWFCASEIVSEEEADAINLESNVLSEDKKYSIEICIVKDLLADLGSFVITAMDEIGVDKKAVVVKSLTTCSVELIAGLTRTVAERDSQNDAADVEKICCSIG